MTPNRLVRSFWLGAAALLVVAALIAIVALLRGELTETDGKILATLGTLFVVGAVGLSGLGLADADLYARFGWAAAALSPVQFTVLALWIWNAVEGDDVDKLGVSVLLVLVGELALELHLLILSGTRLRWLVWVTAALVTSAIALTIAAIWTEPDDESLAKWLAALWIVAGLSWFLLPVLQRYTAAGAGTEDRVLAELDGVELVATRTRDGAEVRLARGERLLLRRRG